MTTNVINNPYNLRYIDESTITLDKIKQSKSLKTGNISNDKDVYADILEYAHSTFDASKFNIEGTPTITKDGIASRFTARESYLFTSCDLSKAKNWKIHIRQKFINGETSCPISFYSALDKNSEIFRLQFNNINQRLIVIGDSQHTILKQFPELNTYYDFEISYNGTHISVETSKNGVTIQKETFEQENIFNVNGYIVIGGSLEANIANTENLIDLKYFFTRIDNITLISGNKTGIYEYTPFKFQLVGSPVISDEGILTSAQTAGNGVKIQLDTTQTNYKIELNFKTGDLLPNYYLCQGAFKIYIGGNGVSFVFAGTSDISLASNLCGELKKNTEYLIYIERNGNAYTVGVKINQEKIFTTQTKEITETISANYLDLGLYTAENSGTVDIDLNKIKEYNSNNLVYQACLKIPYIECDKGSRIVDSIYRERVFDMYSQSGYAPYFTIDEENKNFSLPMGELYGFINKSIQLHSPEINGSSVTFQGGFIIQGGWVAAPYGGTTVYFPKPMSSVWAVVAIDAADSAQNIETSVGSVTTTSFRVRNLASHGVYWIAIGTK